MNTLFIKLPSIDPVILLPKLSAEANRALHLLAARETHWELYDLDIKYMGPEVWMFYGNKGGVCLVCNIIIGHSSVDFNAHGVKHLREHNLTIFL